MAACAAALATPRAIIVASAHWDTATPRVGCAGRLQTIHDFRGFPAPLYALDYPASGSPEAAAEVLEALRAAGIQGEADGARGLDHGAWVPLRLMFPEAGVPVIPLSIQGRGGPRGAWRLGQALAPLRARGFLTIGSGNITHNLHDYALARRDGGRVPAYVRAFADWVAEQLAARDIVALLDYRRLAPAAAQAHPSEEHLLPLFVALGAGGETAQAVRFHAGIDDDVLAMDAWAFQPPTTGDGA
jgi:4,5-DOPA dioxygenase extradiol